MSIWSSLVPDGHLDPVPERDNYSGKIETDQSRALCIDVAHASGYNSCTRLVVYRVGTDAVPGVDVAVMLSPADVDVLIQSLRDARANLK